MESTTARRLDQATYQLVVDQLHKKFGIDFSMYKSSTIQRRLLRRLRLKNVDTLKEYWKHIQTDSEELTELKNDLLIGVTEFFRDTDAFLELEKHVIPTLFEKVDTDPIRIWQVGCATGKETYSLAILLQNYKKTHNKKNDIKIFACDIDPDAISTAGSGIYDMNENKESIPENYLSQYFDVINESEIKVKKELRDMIVFAVHNITSDPPFNRIDLIICRNLLIYLDPDIQNKILGIFHYVLNQNGNLFLGSSESLGDYERYFDTKSAHWKIFKKNNVTLNYPDQILFNFDRAKYTDIPSYIEDNQKKLSATPQTFQSIRNCILEKHLPMCAFLDSTLRYIALMGGVEQYLEYPKTPTQYFADLLPKHLSLFVSTALKDAAKHQKKITHHKVPTSNASIQLTISVEPLTISAHDGYFVTFSETENTDSEPISTPIDISIIAKNRIEDLEDDLQKTKGNLQETVEELESSNEELISTNEELQSTNEELQSLNEELYTVNTEYQEKIRQITQLNSDIENLLHSTQIGTIFLDEELKIRKFTPEMEKHFNLIGSDIGRSILHLATNLNYDDLGADAKIVFETSNPIEKEVFNEKNQCWYLAQILPYQSHVDEKEGVVLTFVNIHQLKEHTSTIETYSKELAKQKETLNLILDNLIEGVTVIDKNGNVLINNKVAQEIQGIELPKNINASNLSEQFGLFLEDGTTQWPEKELPIFQALNGKTFKDYIMLLRNPSHPQGIYLSLSGCPIRDDAGNIVAGVIVHSDISHRRRQEQILLEQKRQLELSNTNLAHFAYVATHDLKSPIVNLNELSQKIEPSNLDDQNQEIISHIQKSTTLLSCTLDNLLEVISIRKTFEDQHQSLSLSEVLDDVLEMIQNDIRQHNVTIHTNFDNLPTISYPKSHLHSILLNLITNAIKYKHPDKDPIIKISCRSEKNIAIVSVEDNGQGIDIDKFGDRIFMIFKRIDENTEGKGIGLYLVKSQVEALGGRIEVKSQLGKGSIFTVYLNQEPISSPQL